MARSWTTSTYPIYHSPQIPTLQRKHPFPHYADDTQLYISFSASDSILYLERLSQTLDRVYSWFCANMLAVNPSKTEYLLIGTSLQRSNVVNSSVYFQNLSLVPVDSARNLGVILDSSLNLKSHISAVCRSSFLQIRQLRQIRSSLDTNSAVLLANAIVHTKIDYCNSLLYGISEYSIVRLQRVQNSLARVVCKSTRFNSHSTDLLKKLHWLPVPQRIKYKIATLTFKALHTDKPSYLAELISWYTPARSLRSSYCCLLHVPDLRTSFGRRSFAFAAPTIWNSLPFSLRNCTSLSTFCNKLKTHLFSP